MFAAGTETDVTVTAGRVTVEAAQDEDDSDFQLPQLWIELAFTTADVVAAAGLDQALQLDETACGVEDDSTTTEVVVCAAGLVLDKTQPLHELCSADLLVVTAADELAWLHADHEDSEL